MEVYEVMKKNQYGQYLKDVMDGKIIPSTFSSVSVWAG